MNPKPAFLSRLSHLGVSILGLGCRLACTPACNGNAMAPRARRNVGEHPIFELSNSADAALAFAPGVDESFELCNITAQGEDGWALIARYGDVNHTGPVGKNTPVVQRFQRADADAIVEDFKRGAGRIRRAVVGVPLLNGHPDAMGLEHIFSDKTVYGAFSTIEARDDGLYGRPVVTNTGGRLIEDGKDRLSPNWDCIAGGTHANGRAILRPFRLKSVGLVRSSAIPNPSLLNSAPPTPPMKTSLLKLLAALVMGLNAATEILQLPLEKTSAAPKFPAWRGSGEAASEEAVVIAHNWESVRKAMWDYVGIVRTNSRLDRALTRVQMVRQEIAQYFQSYRPTSDVLELRNITDVAALVIRSAQLRHESRGLHYTLDYPLPDDAHPPRDTRLVRGG